MNQGTVYVHSRAQVHYWFILRGFWVDGVNLNPERESALLGDARKEGAGRLISTSGVGQSHACTNGPRRRRLLRTPTAAQGELNYAVVFGGGACAWRRWNSTEKI